MARQPGHQVEIRRCKHEGQRAYMGVCRDCGQRTSPIADRSGMVEYARRHREQTAREEGS